MKKSTRITYAAKGASVDFSTYGDQVAVALEDTRIAFDGISSSTMQEALSAYVRSLKWSNTEDTNATAWLEGLTETVETALAERKARAEKNAAGVN
tara:strand:- start:77 stop:364 length:288 start_codon:yes stop_codon:yes gene_type:complete